MRRSTSSRTSLQGQQQPVLQRSPPPPPRPRRQPPRRCCHPKLLSRSARRSSELRLQDRGRPPGPLAPTAELCLAATATGARCCAGAAYRVCRPPRRPSCLTCCWLAAAGTTPWWRGWAQAAAFWSHSTAMAHRRRWARRPLRCATLRTRAATRVSGQTGQQGSCCWRAGHPLLRTLGAPQLRCAMSHMWAPRGTWRRGGCTQAAARGRQRGAAGDAQVAGHQGHGR